MHSSIVTSQIGFLGAETCWPTASAFEAKTGRLEEPARAYLARMLFLQSATDDIQDMFTALGRRLAELQGLAGQDSAEAHALAQATLESYLPLADRLGLSTLATQLQDACFAILLPREYRRLVNKLKAQEADDELNLAMLTHEIRSLMARNGIVGIVRGRIKGLYSLYRKTRRRGYDIERVRDRVAVRIIVSSTDDCYKVMGLIHTHFEYVPGTFDDYIGAPKANGYQSLHTCISASGRRPAEIQIRTLQMHVEAEYGAAAHWRYKQLEAPGLQRANPQPSAT